MSSVNVDVLFLTYTIHFSSTRFIFLLHNLIHDLICLILFDLAWFGLISFGLHTYTQKHKKKTHTHEKGMGSDMFFLMQSLIFVQETIHPSEMAATLARYLSVGVSADDDVFADASLTGVLQPPPGDSIVRANFEPLWLTMGTIQVLFFQNVIGLYTLRLMWTGW
jgi:hypothetical protein